MFTPALLIPFIVVVKYPRVRPSEVELIILTGVEVTPFTVVDKVFVLLVLLIELTAGAVTVTPLIVEVIVLTALLNVCVVATGAAFDGAQLFPFQVRTWPFDAPVVVPNGDPFIFETTEDPRLPVTSPAILAVKVPDATPLIVLTNWLLLFCASALLFMIFTFDPVIPLTVVLSVLPDEVLATLVTELLLAETPFTTLVNVLPETLRLCVVAGTNAERFTGKPVMPLTVVVKLVPFISFATVLTSVTEVPVTPLTVVVKLLLAEVLETLFTMGTPAPVTPFTVVVNVLGAAFVLLTVVAGDDTVAGAHDDPLQVKTWPLAGAVVATALPCKRFAFQ